MSAFAPLVGTRPRPTGNARREVLYRLQETAKKEFAEDSSTSGKLMTGIRVGTRTLFEMNESINRLNMIKVDAKWAEFRDLLKQAFRKTKRVREAAKMPLCFQRGYIALTLA